MAFSCSSCPRHYRLATLECSGVRVLPAESDGYPTDLIMPTGATHGTGGAHGPMDLGGIGSGGGVKDYSYPLEQRAATLWYHDHHMDFTGLQVYRGLAGFYIVPDDEEGTLPLPSWEEFDQGATLDGLGEAERTVMHARATDQPFGTAVQALQLNNPAREALPKTAIWCTSRSSQVHEMVARGLPHFSALAGPEWQFVDLLTGHWPMFSRPDDLADLLAAVAQV